MKKRLAILTGGLALGLGGLMMALWAHNADPAVQGEAPPKAASSRIVNVTVYPNSALVTREVEVPAGQGTIELVVTPLPEHTVHSSLYSEGTDGVRVLTTRFRTRPVQEDTREEVRKLEDEIRKLQMAGQRMQADLKACEQNMGLLGKLENFTSASTQSATEKGKLDSDATIALAKYLMEGRSEKTREMVALQQQQQTNAEQLEFAQRKLRDMTAGSSKTERDAVIVVDRGNAAPSKVRLNYLVDAAAWRPQYKLRAGKDAKDNVQLEYLAAIFQQTGEDWQNVNLVLSTAEPRLNAAPPELKMLAVNVVPKGTAVAKNPMPIPNPPGQTAGGGQPGGPAMGKGGEGWGRLPAGGVVSNPAGQNTERELKELADVLRKQAQDDVNRNKDSQSAEIFNYAAALDQARDLVLMPEEATKPSARGLARGSQHEGPSVTYDLSARISVPSRNDEQVLEVTRIDMAPEYFYKAVPVLTPHVYRQANLTNKSKYVLLPGEATMYNGTHFVGRMNLPLVAIGEQFTVGFGTDPQLQVHRQMMDKARTMQGGNQILKFEYRILVSSYKPERVKLQVWDRLPAGENETVGVQLVKSTPEVSKDAMYLREDRPHNLLRWDLEVDPDMNGEKAQAVQYEFKMELDRQMSIGTFQSK
jgi:hypothetical protein